MAKRRRKKSSLKGTIKYEVYGILIIIFSIISLAGKNGQIPGIGPVGRSLNHICSFLMGYWFFIIPLFFIYIGLFVMIKRKWPQYWSYKKTGLLVAIISILVTFHIELMEQLFPAGNYSSKLIISHSYDYITSILFNSNLIAANENLGGGMIGAVLYGVLHFLFGYVGSIFMIIALFAIAFICLTGFSYVEIGLKINRFFSAIFNKISKKINLISNKYKQKKKIKRMTDKSPNVQIKGQSIKDEFDEESYHDTNPGSKKTPLLFQLFQSKTENSNNSNENENNNENVDVVHKDVNETANAPLFRDFQDRLDHSEETVDDVIIKPKNQALLEKASSASSPDSMVDDIDLNDDKQSHKVPYQLPPFHLLSRPASLGKNGSGEDYKANARKLEATLESFGVRTKVLEVVRGPSVTRYEIQPDIGVKVSRIVSLTDDIALALAAKDIRMEAPIPGKSAIGIEVPNTEVSIVTMREVMESSAFLESDSKLSITLGRDISGQPIIGNLAKMPHLLVAGATGSGKSVCINGIIVSILYKAKPHEVKFLMIDPKKVELNVYNGIPHLLAPVVTDPRRASLALKKVVSEMEKRYELFSNAGARNIEGYNEILAETKESEALPYIVVIVDELADLMMVAAKDVEDAICRLAQMARAAGIHLIIATQRPSVDVITGVIKANIPSRIAFGVSSQVDSRTILDTVGAEKLLGRGDMLFLPVGASKSLRVQGAFLSDHEVESVVSFVKNQEKAKYQEEMVPEVEEQVDSNAEVEDELFDQAVQIILEAKQASVSLLQRRMRVGYTRAARLIDSMEAKNIVGPYEGSKPREVLITMEQYHNNRISS